MLRDVHLLDIPALLGLAKKYNDEVASVGLFVAGIDYELAATNMMSSLNNPGAFAKVVVSGTQVVGFAWGVLVNPVPWSMYTAADLLMFYILPEHRRSLHGYQLLKSYKAWAESSLCDEIRISTASGIKTDIANSMFKRLGFTEFGMVYHIKK